MSKEKAPKKQKGNSQFRETVQRLKKNKSAVVGLIIVIIMVLLAVFAPLIAPYSYEEANYDITFQGPTAQHWFGTDDLGRDILSRLIYGGRYSLRIGILSVLGATLGGIILGSIAGYFGGNVDNLIMRILDVFQAIPGMVLSIAVAAVVGPGFNNCILALVIGMTPSFSRMMRASILNVRKMEYLEAATSINCSNFRIITKHVLPNALSPLIVQATMSVPASILLAASLSYIGLGVQPPTPEWGAMLAAGRGYIRDYPHLVLFPGITIMIAVLALNLFGDGLRDAMDPKLRN